MKSLSNTSVFKISILMLILVITKSNALFILFSLFLLISNWKDLLWFILFSLIVFLSLKVHTIIPEVSINNPIKNILINRLDNFTPEVKSILLNILFNEYDYNNSFNLGYGVSYYYVFKFIDKKNKNVTIPLVLLLSLLFGYKTKYILIIIENILNRFKLNKQRKNAYIILVLLMLIPNSIQSKSIIIVLLIKIFNCIETKLKFKTFMALLESYFFNQISLSIIMFKYFIYIRVIIMLFSLIVFITLSFTDIYLVIINLYSKLNSISQIGIRGKINIIPLIIFLLIINVSKYNFSIIQISILSLFLILPINNPFFSISFIDVGQGDSILIHDCLNLGNVLIDTGSKYNYFKLKNYLYSKGIYTIDYLVITHYDEDHSGNIESLENDFKIKRLIDKGEDINFRNIKLKYLYLGNYDNENDNSLVYYGYFNSKYYLFTADISSLPEKELVNLFNHKVDVLKVAHHGSKYSSSDYLISNTLPKYSIISTNGKYNHPSNECLNTLNAYLSKIFITKDKGTIEFYLLNIGDFIKTDSSFEIIH